jgi:hypothetical protein
MSIIGVIRRWAFAAIADSSIAKITISRFIKKLFFKLKKAVGDTIITTTPQPNKNKQLQKYVSDN